MAARKDIVVVGASAGGMDALQKLVAGLPAGLPVAIFVVWHLSPGVRSVLPDVLTRNGPLPARHPEDGDAIEPGRIYIAPPDRHMLLERDYIRVARGPKENRFRPAVDPLFRSAAYVFGARAVGIVLSGALDDGTSGLWTIKMRGGTAIVQDPADALHRSMPLNAMENVAIDHKARAADLGPLIARLALEPAGPDRALAEEDRRRVEREIRIAEEFEALDEHVLQHGELAPYTCPECHGVLAQIQEGRIVRFRCHTGHAFSAATLLDGVTEQIEARLWDAVRAYDETVLFLNRMGEQLAKAGNTKAAELCFDKAREAHERSRPVREAALRTETLTDESVR
ncbi:MAG: chemotaxis protein CheB [Betaproteobacteria bacterium]|nr:chemotaxis protein CheB [Betaproteobacteria bacterium]